MSQPRIFTRDTLEAIAHQRGENYPSSPVLGEALLSYMRSRGQLELNVDQVKAREDFQALARHIGFDSALPPEQPHEFKPFSEMRRELATMRLRYDQDLAQYKAKRDDRAQKAAPPSPPPPQAVPTPVKPRAKAAELMTKLANAGATALKSVQAGQRERSD